MSDSQEPLIKGNKAIQYSDVHHPGTPDFLSPKDVPAISKRIRWGVFFLAWTTVAVFVALPIGGVYNPIVQTIASIVIIAFQIYWLQFLSWVNRFSRLGCDKIRKQFEWSEETRVVDGHTEPPPNYETPRLTHWVVLPNYKEDIGQMRAAIRSVQMQTVGAQNIVFVLACEAAEAGVDEKAAKLGAEFPSFKRFLVNVHQLVPGETAGKSANVSSAFRSLVTRAHCEKAIPAFELASMDGIGIEPPKNLTEVNEGESDIYASFLKNGIIHIMDADSVYHPHYFFAVEHSFHFEKHATRLECIWQSPICNWMNVARIPCFSRVMSSAVTLHELASLAHPTTRKLPFSTYSMSTTLALRCGGWASDIIAEDWHSHMRAFMATRGKVQVVPVFLPVICYSVEGDNWWRSFVERYHQAVRHSWASIEAASFFAMWRDMDAALRPPKTQFFELFGMMVSLHYLGVYQTPLAVAAAISQFVFSWLNGLKFYEIPDFSKSIWTPLGTSLFSWILFMMVSIMTLVLPFISILIMFSSFKYENALREIYVSAHANTDKTELRAFLSAEQTDAETQSIGDIEAMSVSDVHRSRAYIEKYLCPPKHGYLYRFKCLVEIIFVMPIAGFIYGFIPELYCQTILPFKRSMGYRVAAKPTL